MWYFHKVGRLYDSKIWVTSMGQTFKITDPKTVSFISAMTYLAQFRHIFGEDSLHS